MKGTTFEFFEVEGKGPFYGDIYTVGGSDGVHGQSP